MRYSLGLVILASLAFTLGGVCMKFSDGLTRLVPAVLLYVLFAVGATLQTVAMRRADLGVVYVVVLGLEAVLAFAFGALIFRETTTLWKMGGVALVVAGIALLHFGE
jgi:multidrug transporter EmrE-like cation transporter